MSSIFIDIYVLQKIKLKYFPRIPVFLFAHLFMQKKPLFFRKNSYVIIFAETLLSDHKYLS